MFGIIEFADEETEVEGKGQDDEETEETFSRFIVVVPPCWL
jgi:hypothetical protein